MSQYTKEIEKRRTFAIISHPDAGKTTLTEKFLLYGGAINLAGSVKGKATARHAVSDWMEIEKERGISVTSSVLQFHYDGYCINILDTPGHQDFSEDTYRTLMAADSAVMVIDGSKGVEAQTRKLFKVCVMRHIPIFTFINKMDRDANDTFDLLDEIEKELGIACLGCIPVLKWLDLKSRHLGLLLPDEIGNLQEQMERLSQVLEESVDVERLLELGRGPQRRHESGADQEDGAGREDEAGREDRAGRKKKQGEETFCLAAAMDEAFCFYYQENLELLRELGARIVPFSPLRDEKLPEQTDGILLGGGYPELYAAELGENRSMREFIRRAAEEGMPILGECGGYLYLLEELEGEDGNMYPMAGVFSGSGKREERLRHFGYVTVQTGADSSYLKKGQQIRGHEFHYWHCQKDETEGAMEAKKPLGGKKWPAMRIKHQVTAGFPHLYYPSLPEFAERFARACMEYGQRRNRQ